MLRARKHFRTAADQKKRWALLLFQTAKQQGIMANYPPPKVAHVTGKNKFVWYNNWVNASKCNGGKRWWELITQPFSDTGVSSFERSLIYFPAAVWILHVNEAFFIFILFFNFFTAIALMQPWVSDKSTALMTLTANVICFGPWSGSLYVQLSDYKVVHVWSENAVINSERGGGAFNWTEVINSQLSFTQEKTSCQSEGFFSLERNVYQLKDTFPLWVLAKRVLEPNAEVTVPCTVMRAKVFDTWKQTRGSKVLKHFKPQYKTDRINK